MKKIYRFILCAFMCVSVIFTCSAVISAAPKIAKVKNVTVSSVAADKVTLKWKKVSGVTGYRVYRYSPAKEKYVYEGKTSKLKFTVSSLYAGKTYKFKVRAYKTSGGKTTYGAYSDVVRGTTTPKKVTGIKKTYVGTSTVKLSWSKTKGATGYEIFIYDSKKKAYVSKGTVTNNSCALTKLTQNTSYKIKIAAFHKKGGNGKVYGLKSSAYTFRTAIPSVYNIKLYDVTESSFTIKWSAVKGADGYVVYRYDDYDGWKKVKTTSAASYSVKNLESGTAKSYRVRAYIKNGSSYNYGGYSDTVVGNTLPKAPTNLSATTDDKVVYLTWKGSGRATGYEISRFDPTTNSWQTIGKTSYDTFTDDSITKAGSYSYVVRAYVSGDKTYTTSYSAPTTIFCESNYMPDSPYGNTVMAEAGVLGFLYDPYEVCFYTASDPWQRKIGYNEIFDIGAGLVAIYIDTVRVKFEYQDKDWMLQLWKGQYGWLFYGAEVGLYNKPKDRDLDHYDCAEDNERIRMSMEFYDSGVHKFSRPLGYYWWCTGFVPTTPLAYMTSQARKNLRVEARLVIDDPVLFAAIRNALEAEEVTSQGVRYDYMGQNIYITYQ